MEGGGGGAKFILWSDHPWASMHVCQCTYIVIFWWHEQHKSTLLLQNERLMWRTAINYAELCVAVADKQENEIGTCTCRLLGSSKELNFDNQGFPQRAIEWYFAGLLYAIIPFDVG